MRIVCWTIVPGLMLSASGCLVGPDYHPPETQMPTEWSGGRALASQPAAATTQPVDLTRWWDSLEDPQLSQLIEIAARNNYDVQFAEARVREARALRQIAAADFWPQIGFGSSYAYRGSSRNTSPRPASRGGGPIVDAVNSAIRRFSLNPGGFDPATNSFTGPSINVSPSQTAIAFPTIGETRPGAVRRDSNLFQYGFDAFWELDIFGRIRRSVEAAEADYAALEEARRNTLQTVLAEVARNYIELRGAQRRLVIALENIEVQENTLEITEIRHTAGFTTELDVAQARSQLERTRAQVPFLEATIRQRIHQISVLLGQPPATFVDALLLHKPLPGQPPEVPMGIPSDLLRRRPDIRQAERQIAAATARIGVAVAELFPQFTINASFGGQATEIRNLLNAQSFGWSVGPGFQWPIFQGGRLRANIRVEEAREAQALATYGQTVINALQEVENALVAYTQEQQRMLTLREAVAASQLAVELSTDLYTRGLGPFLNVLSSEQSLYSAQDELVVSETAVMTSLIALYKALGGGWEPFEEPTPTTAPALPPILEILDVPAG